MSTEFGTPQDVEDAFYDALDESDLAAMKGIWEQTEDVVCLIPMAPLRIGYDKVLEGWQPLLQGQVKIDIEVRHLHWIESGDLAIHLVQEHITVIGQTQKQPPMYATNTYRRGEQGWRLIMHQNAPTPPPPGMMHPDLGPG